MELNSADIERIRKMPMNFVVGKERSGTTLLQVILNAHPNIVAPPESRFIVLLYNRYGAIKQWSEKNVLDFCNDLFREGLFKNQWGMDKLKLRDSLLSVKDSLSYPLLCKIIFIQWGGEGKDVKMIFDKNPVYYYFLPKLEMIFPEANFIHIVRDYRANIVSHQRVFKIKRAADLAYRWLKIDELIEKSKLRKVGRYFTLKYETLVLEPESSIKSMCEFFGIPFSENMVKDHTSHIYSTFNENKRERFREMHRSLFTPMNVAHVDEWREKLSPDEVREAEAVAGEYGKVKYNYPIISAKPLKLNILKVGVIKIKFVLIKIAYKVIFSKLALYYFIRWKVWRDF
ncbi:MAG TPA: sulfotransferase [Bacteroidia bacterium]|jgi:hypothetical protein|nr:sulfotransferase [Bacteroidia bacterium]